MSTSKLEESFLGYWRMFAKGYPEPEREKMFHEKRKWRVDFLWPEQKVIVEIEGGEFSQGRHQRPIGFSRDCEKYNAAQVLGYKVFRATTLMLKQDPLSFIELIKKEIKK